jgi:hypothetical protein
MVLKSFEPLTSRINGIFSIYRKRQGRCLIYEVKRIQWLVYGLFVLVFFFSMPRLRVYEGNLPESNPSVVRVEGNT